ncbi:MAG TPA: protein tyrosine phosphatase family protein [Pelolinea sp.]|nr:protein tyrosine phosphatase family protein [Pelolinea sp.]
MLTDIPYYFPLTGDVASAGQPSEAQLREVQAAGFSLVINLALHDNPEYSLPDERGTVEGLGMKYIHIPVQFDHPTQENLAAFFEAMAQNEGRKIFVHCAVNMHVSVFLGLYLRIKKGHEKEKAFELMRKVWEPNEVWSAFITAMLNSYGTVID